MKKSTKKNENKKTVAEIVTQRFIDALEGGKVPWIKPWECWTSWSRATGNDYRGANQLTLSGGEYVTFKQATEQGIKINKGAKSEMIVKYTDYKKTVTEEEAAQMVAEFKISAKQVEHLDNGKCKVPARSIKYYNVFNVETCTDAEQKHEKDNKRHEWDAIEKAEEVATGYMSRGGVELEEGSNRAYYTAFGHDVTLPRREQFKSAEAYYSTLFHELTHSTAKTMGRDLTSYHRSKKARAREELVAEIGAAYIMSYLGIESGFTVANSNEYVRGWAENLKSDPNAILWAAPKAIEAANLILNIQ